MPAKSRNDESTKTRIETVLQFFKTLGLYVVMTNPLKQGLKLQSPMITMIRMTVVMTNPLKQGLKQDMQNLVKLRQDSRNDESTKTRIETRQ